MNLITSRYLYLCDFLAAVCYWQITIQPYWLTMEDTWLVEYNYLILNPSSFLFAAFTFSGWSIIHFWSFLIFRLWFGGENNPRNATLLALAVLNCPEVVTRRVLQEQLILIGWNIIFSFSIPYWSSDAKKSFFISSIIELEIKWMIPHQQKEI